MKKKIIVWVFSLLILITAITFLVGAIVSYNYDMDPANGVDIFEGFAAFLIIVIGGFVVLYELDLFYTLYYFFIKPRTITKSILNILSNFSFALIFIYSCLSSIYMELRAFEKTPLILFLIYIILRGVYLMVATSYANKEE